MGNEPFAPFDRLAALLHVNQMSAPALAASLRLAAPPAQPTLFDSNGDDECAQEPA